VAGFNPVFWVLNHQFLWTLQATLTDVAALEKLQKECGATICFLGPMSGRDIKWLVVWNMNFTLW
jgi:hypothetical protein